jgi:hypothetical protein
MREDVGLDLISDGLPARREICVAADLGKFRRAVQGDPAHQLGGHIVLRLAASLLDALVGFADSPTLVVERSAGEVTLTPPTAAPPDHLVSPTRAAVPEDPRPRLGQDTWLVCSPPSDTHH